MARIIDIVRAVAPKAAPPYVRAFDQYGDQLFAEFGLTTEARVSEFLARCLSETGYFKTLTEDPNYSRGNLADQWNKGNGHEQFGSRAEMMSYAGRPEDLFNRWYGGRMGNGGPASGDGYRYRGRGPLQTTGKAAYRKYGRRAGVDLVANPDLLLDPRYILLPSLYEWQDGNLNAYADKGDTLSIARKINVGNVKTTQIPNGYADQVEARRRVRAAIKRLGGLDLPAAPATPSDAAPAVPVSPAPPAPPVDAPAAIDPDDGLTSGEIRALQQRLRDLGYSEVGRVDGLWGPRTVAAVSAFQATADLPVTGKLDKTTAASLTTAGPRPVGESRETTTAATMRQHGDPVAKASWWSKACAWVMGAPAAAVGIVGQTSDATDKLGPVKSFLGDVPMWAWAGAVVGVAIALYVLAQRSETAAVDAVRSGRDAGPA